MIKELIMKCHQTILRFILIVIIIALLSGCDNRDNDNDDYEIVSLSISPDQIYSDDSATTNALVEARVEDSNGLPAKDIPVYFLTDIGNMINSAVTDSAGIAVSIFFDDGQAGTAHISASLYEDGSLAVVDSLFIIHLPYYITSITINPHQLYADNQIETSSEVRVTVINYMGFPEADAPVIFTTDLGYIQGKVYTDESGVALTTFNDNGIVGTAHISACIEGFENAQVVRDSVQILSNPHLKIISITATPNVIFLDNGITSSEIEVLVHDHNGNAAGDEDVYFSASIGNIITHVATGANGIAVSSFWDDGITGIAEIDAFVGIADTTITVTIIDSDVIDISLDELPQESAVNNVISVSASALNVVGAVPDCSEITFFTELGFFQVSATDHTPLGTNTIAYTYNGTATVYLNTGNQPGLNHITAQITADQAGNVLTDSAEMEILPDEVDHLTFTSPSIALPACNDNSVFSEICLELRDTNENLVLQPCQVWYRFLSRPEGSNIENIVYNYTDSTSVISIDGEAIVHVFSGTQTGIIVLQAWIRDTSGQMISAVFENIVVQPGPPSACQLNISGMDTAEDMGGGIWKLEISAYLSDAWDHPVSDGLVVYFSLDPNPDYASVEAPDSYVGNENQSGNSLPGTAFSSLVFDGAFTNEDINLKANITNSLVFEQELLLPLQFGEISMICTPIHCDWVEEGDEEDKLTQCRVSVRDGQQNPVSNQRVIFTSTLGDATDENIHPVLEDIDDPLILELYDWEGINVDDDPYDGYTGWYEGQLGVLYKYVVFHKYECPPPLPAPPGMTTGMITSTIHGTFISANQTITLFRYVD
jgi:hypothetical protein